MNNDHPKHAYAILSALPGGSEPSIEFTAFQSEAERIARKNTERGRRAMVLFGISGLYVDEAAEKRERTSECFQKEMVIQ